MAGDGAADGAVAIDNDSRLPPQLRDLFRENGVIIPRHWDVSHTSREQGARFAAVYERIASADSAPFVAGQLQGERVIRTLRRRLPIAARVDEDLTLPFPIPLGLEDIIQAGTIVGGHDSARRARATPEMIREFEKVITSKAVRVASECNFWCPMFTVEQHDKHRLIFDLRAFNQFGLDPHFKMETIADVPTFAAGGRFMCKLDLRSAFWQYPVNSELASYLGTSDPRDPTNLYQWQCLPMGLARSPLVWSATMGRFVNAWRKAGLRVMIYIDDILIVSDTVNELASAVEAVVHDLIDAGIRISSSKSFIAPFRVLDFLGLTVNLTEQAFVIPDTKLQRIALDARQIRDQGPLPIKDVEAFLGRVAFAATACPWLAFFRSAITRDALGSQSSTEWTPDAKEELLWWIQGAERLLAGKLWHWRRLAGTRIFARRRRGAQLFDYEASTDASETGIGRRLTTGRFDSEPLPPWLPPSAPSVARELYGILRLVEVEDIPPGSSLRVVCDATGAVSTANGNTVAPSTAYIARRLFLACLEKDIVLVAEWAPREMLDDEDEWSRKDATDLSHALLTPETYSFFHRRYFGGRQPDTIFFSAAHNRIHAPHARYCTRLPETNSLGDGVSSPAWQTASRGWAYPPFPLVRAVLRRIALSPSPPRVIVVLPDSAFTRHVLRYWEAVDLPSQHCLTPPRFTHSIPLPIRLTAFVSPTLSTRHPPIYAPSHHHRRRTGEDTALHGSD